MDLETRFLAKVQIAGENDCWQWRGSRAKDNYGRIRVKGKLAYAHRVAFELKNGAIPTGMSVLHSCDNPPCVNPKHLRLGTAKENVHDMIVRGRAKNTRVLTLDDVNYIRKQAKNKSRKVLALEFGVNPITIQRAILGE